MEGGALDAAYEAIQPTKNRPTLSRPVIVAPSLVADAIDSSLNHATHSGLLQERLPVGADDNQTLDLINQDVNSSERSEINT